LLPLVFVDESGVCCGDAGGGAMVRDALVDALMEPGGVVMLLVLGQDGAQVRKPGSGSGSRRGAQA
jgi:hypothetical protein